MAYEIIMPKAGMAMETGTVIQWFKSVGDYVESGEPLLEIETDKVSMEVEAEVSGYLLQKLREPGEVVPVIETIGYLGEKGETPPDETPRGDSAPESQGAESQPVDDTPAAPPDEPPTASGDGRIPATPAAKRLASERGVDLSSVVASGPHGAVRLRDVESATTGGRTSAAASPLARKVAEGEGLNLSDLEGSGPGGRIMRRDVVKAFAGMRQIEPGEAGPEERVAMSGMRKAIRDRMLESHLTMPPVTLHAKIDVTELMKFRTHLNEDSEMRFSLNDLILKATAKAVSSHPPVRTTIDGDELVTWNAVHLGMAVAIDNGLMVPVIPDADRLTLSELATHARTLAGKVRSGKIAPDELKGGTFTVTNLGMYGIHSFTPIINPPQSAILGVNTAAEELAMDDDGVVSKRHRMMLSLTIDHRVIDGAQGAQFLATMRELLEKPLSIVV
ncbi:MAG: dihydrolipoamide acetyltransferase family protein [Spirochaetota bacterium]